MGEGQLVNVTCYGVDVGFEDNSSEAPVPTQEDISITGKLNLDTMLTSQHLLTLAQLTWTSEVYWQKAYMNE